MAANTKIAWATHSFSPWIGCSKIARGCQNCYAAEMAGRLGVTWGQNGTRRRTAESTWKQVERWNRKAAPGICTCPGGIMCPYTTHNLGCPAVRDRPRVFPSLCDPFEDHAYCNAMRPEFFALIDRCPNLDFLLLTKRPENVRRMWPWDTPPDTDGTEERLHRHNIWLLYSASDQRTLDAWLPHLLACRDLVSVLGLSLEPLIGPVDLWPYLDSAEHGPGIGDKKQMPDWVIVGGESGPRARPCDVSWIRSIVDQCHDAGIPCFVKQDSGRQPGQQGRIPDDLWAVKQFPKPRVA